MRDEVNPAIKVVRKARPIHLEGIVGIVGRTCDQLRSSLQAITRSKALLAQQVITLQEIERRSRGGSMPKRIGTNTDERMS